jgi:hypothetical protein
MRQGQRWPCLFLSVKSSLSSRLPVALFTTNPTNTITIETAIMGKINERTEMTNEPPVSAADRNGLPIPAVVTEEATRVTEVAL